MLINTISTIKTKRHLKHNRLVFSLPTISLLMSAILLSSCGFHLRSYGENASNIKSLSLNCPNTSSWELCHHLKQTLLLNNIQISDKAPLVLSIGLMIQKSRVLSLQANASAAEQGLSSEVTYTITSSSDDDIKHKQSVHINNSYRHESSALLAKDRERDELQMQLSQHLAEEIVRQITILNPENWIKTTTTDSANNNQNNVSE